MNLVLHERLCHDVHALCVAKNKRYDDSFSKTVRKYGLISALTRMGDKWSRTEALILHHATESADESLTDTLMDLANYCLMTICEIEDANLRSAQASVNAIDEAKHAQTAANSSTLHPVADYFCKVTDSTVSAQQTCVDSAGYTGPMTRAYDTARSVNRVKGDI